jgi:hypothetical protein
MAAASPKRKRGCQAVPLLETSQLSSTPALQPQFQTGGDDSPRTVVAGRLQQLDLENEEVFGFSRGESHGRKRARSDEAAHDSPRSSPCPVPEISPSEGVGEDTSSGVSFTFRHEDSMPDVGAGQIGQSARRKSPSLLGEINDLFWIDEEITGHDPDDPADDGYGINGIGFRPTAGQAYQRSQRRKQQLAEYRSRETKDARQRRSERRRMPAGGVATTPSGKDTKTRVHFEDG